MFVVTALFFFNIFKFTWNPKRIELRAYPAPASIIPTENVINRVLTNSKNLPIDKRLTAIFQTLVFSVIFSRNILFRMVSVLFSNAILTNGFGVWSFPACIQLNPYNASNNILFDFGFFVYVSKPLRGLWVSVSPCACQRTYVFVLFTNKRHRHPYERRAHRTSAFQNTTKPMLKSKWSVDLSMYVQCLLSTKLHISV